MSDINIMMLGARATGKTSLLAAMYSQFNDVIANVNLQLTPDEDTMLNLQNCLAELKKIIDKRLGIGEGVEGTAEWRRFEFGIGKKGASSAMNLVFNDFPGGDLETKESLSKVKELIKKSSVLMIIIDSPYLIEENGIYNSERNRKEHIINLIKKAYADLEENKLVLIVPVKHELYYINSKNNLKPGMVELNDKLKIEYKDLFNFFSSNQIRDKVTLAITPVQTIGGLKFRSFENVNGTVVPKFRRTKPNSMFEPLDSDQPLRYILRFLIKTYNMRKKNIIQQFLDAIFDTDKPFKDAVEKFALGCKADEGFEVVQGEHLI